jgi:tripartite-type tricarboxylate transporter receptor subunit TctC
MPTRRTIIFSAAAWSFAGALAGTQARAQPKYPTRVVRIVIANPPGGDDDTLTRFIGDAVAPTLGQSVIVDNRGGASTTIGSGYVAQAAPDGYTILCLHAASLVQTVLRDNLRYSMKSFAPVIKIGGYPMALVVSAKSDIKSIDDVKAIATRADGISYASGGAGTMAHLTAVRFLKAIGGRGLHVTYKNNPEGLQSLIGGYTQMMFPSAREAAAMRGDGLLRVLAVTSPKRTDNLPDVPTMAELGFPDVDSQLWYSYAAPAGTPPAILSKLADSISTVVQSKPFHDRFDPLSFQTDIRTGDDLVRFWEEQSQRWRAVVTENNIKFTD